MTEVQDPFEILEGMRQIALADMMGNVGYISDEVRRPERRESVCRGHKACAVGSAWLAAGVPIMSRNRGWRLPGVEPGPGREQFLARRPALRLAFSALNAAASEYIERHEIDPDHSFADPIEALFESEDPKLDGGQRRRAMLRVISAAKRKAAQS